MIESVKTEMRVPWSPGTRELLWRSEIRPTIISDRDSLLVVRTDSDLPALQPGAVVKVEVVAAGGMVVAQDKGIRGEGLRFETGQWKDGAYELRCSTTAPDGHSLVVHLPWYKGDILAAARHLVVEADQADLSTPAGLIQAMLADMVKDRLGENLQAGNGDLLERVHSALMEWEELEQAAAGGPGPVRPYGFVRLAYRDEVDGAPQFCKVYLPGEYDPAEKWPMVVNLHGFNLSNPPYVQWPGVDHRHIPYVDKDNVIILCPHGRRSGWYGAVRERNALQQTVLHCIDLAKQHFSVDDERIYLMGYSMGGVGVWHIGTCHPELFAAIAPIFGAYEARDWLEEEKLMGLSEHERFYLEWQSSFAQAEALLHVPVFVNHGDADDCVEVTLSRRGVRLLQRWGYDVRYWEHPGKGHGDLGCEDVLMQWFLSHKRKTDPRQVRIRAAELKSAAAYWVRIEQRKDPFAFILTDAEIMAPNLVRLDTENVLEVTLSPRTALVDATKLLEVLWNGTDRRTVELQEGKITLRAKGYTPGPLRKRPELEGPIADVINTPFAIIQGTISSDPDMRRMCAHRSQAMALECEQRQHWKPRCFRDTEISEADMAKYSLLLIGGPDDNLVTQKLSGKLPLKIFPDQIVIDDHSFSATDAAVKMVYPNPLNANRYVLVTAANSAKGMPLVEHIPLEVDFAIVDGRVASDDEGGVQNQVRVIVLGILDHQWRLDEAFVETADFRRFTGSYAIPF